MSSDTGLRRDLGVWGAASIVVGTIIGSGIFLVPRTMILQVGDTRTLFAVWIVGGLLSLAGALTYAELSAMMPEAGGENNYLREAYGPFFGFLNGWTQMWVAKSGSVATLATGFFYYLANFMPSLERVAMTLPVPIGDGGGPLEVRWGQLLAMGLILTLGVVNWFGLRAGARLQIAATVLKVGLIAGIVAAGLMAEPGSGSAPVSAPGGAAGFFGALVAALWAYDGWNNLTMVAGEVRNPQRSLPLALVIGTAFVMAVYLVTNAAYFHVLSPADVASSDRVAAEMMRRIAGEGGAALVSIAAMISIFAALNGSLLSGARVPFSLARDGYFFRRFGHVNERHHVPGFSILAVSGWSAILVLTGRYDQLLTMVILPSWVLYGMATASVFVLRRKQPERPRPYRTIGYPLVPLLFVFGAAVLIYFTVKNSPRESIIGLTLVAAGLPFYFHWRTKARQKPPRID